MNQSCTLRYTTLTQKSITQGDGYVFLGTYNNNPSLVNTNYIYRSPDDGQTWSVVNTPTTMRHIHGLAFDPSKHRLYVLGGDAAGDGLWYSSDDGSTLQPLCTDYRCIGIEGIISGNSIVFGTDNPGAVNHIVKVDANSGAYVDIATITYPSYSSGTTGGVWLVGETHEAGAAIVNPQIHLYGSSDGGATWSILYSFTIPSSSDYEIHVESVYPNGDVAVDVSGQGHGRAAYQRRRRRCAGQHRSAGDQRLDATGPDAERLDRVLVEQPDVLRLPVAALRRVRQRLPGHPDRRPGRATRSRQPTSERPCA